MACNNTYIGARYVPVYADPVEWSPDREYEHLTIVTHEGNSYTSRCAVPIGITLDNKEYWVQSFLAPPEIVAINAKIKTIQQELAQQADNIASIEEEIKNLQGGSSALETRVSALETSQATQDTEISNIKTEQNTQNTDIQNLKTDATNLDTRVTTLETSQAAQDEKIAALEEKDTTLETDIAQLQTSQAAQDTEIATIKQLQAAQANDMSDLNTRLTAAELQVETNKTDIAALNTKTDKTNTALSALSATVQAHTQSITKLNGDVIDLNAEVTNLKDVNAQLAERLDNQETELNTTNANVSNLATAVANQTTAINSIQTQLNDQHNDINNLQGGQSTLTNQYNTLTQSLTETNNTVSGIQSDIDEINEKIKDVPSDITSLTGQVNQNTADIETNDADILALQTSQQQQDTKIASLETSQATQDTKITSLETEVGNHDMMIETLETDMNALETHVSGLTSKVDTNTTDIQTMQSKILRMTQYWVNVKDYGAKGDGTTDDTQAIKNAIAVVHQTSSIDYRYTTLLFPDGVYKISEYLSIHGHVNVVGVGKVVILRVSGTGTIKDAMEIGDNTQSTILTTGMMSNIVFNDISGSTTSVGVSLVNVDRFIIQDCEFIAFNQGIFLRGDGNVMKSVLIQGCVFSRIITQLIHIIGIIGNKITRDIYVDHCITRDPQKTFIDGYNSMNHLSITNCDISIAGFINWHWVDPTAGSIVSDIKVSGNQITSSSDIAIDFRAPANFSVNEILIADNTINCTNNAAINLNRCTDIHISGNSFYNASTSIIVKTNGNCIINNNMFGGTSANNQVGIHSEDMGSLTIVGNLINGMQRGIYIDEGSYVTIVANTFTNNQFNYQHITIPSNLVKIGNNPNV